MLNQVLDLIQTVQVLLFVAVLIVVTIVLFKFGVFGKAKPNAGQKGKAVVLAVERDQSREVKGAVTLKIVLDIQLPGHAAYTIRTKRKVPTSQAETLFYVGQALEVMIKSKNGEEVAILGFDPVPNAYAGAKSNPL